MVSSQSAHDHFTPCVAFALGKLFTGLKKLSELNLNFLVPLLSEMEADQLLSWEVKPGGPVPVEQNVACLDAMSAWFHHHLGLN